MRGIIFRGKRTDNGEWVSGNLFVSDTDGRAYILAGSRTVKIEWEVDPSTVGQYTGLIDSNGMRIFEGDILLLDDIRGIVNYGTGCFCVNLPRPSYLYRNNPAIDIVLNEYPGLEIIGNAHDNPEIIDKE